MLTPWKNFPFAGLGVVFCCANAAPPTSSIVKTQAVNTFDKAMNLALQGDMKTALPIFNGLPVEVLPAAQAQAVRVLLTRFDGSYKAPGAMDPLAERSWGPIKTTGRRSCWAR